MIYINNNNKITNQTSGFTLVELVVVIAILAILAIIAAPRFINLSSEAKKAALGGINASIKTANSLVYAKSKIPSTQVQAVSGRDDIIDIDLDGDGNFETRLKWGYLDNTDLDKWADIDDSFTTQFEGIANTYVGYDANGDNKVTDDNCYFHYVQAANSHTEPQYNIVDSGC